MPEVLSVNGKEYKIIKLLGKGKGGYSYLAELDRTPVVLKQIHHEPCDYYSFGNKIEFMPKDLIFLSMSQTLEMINILAPTGAMFENEKRVALGLKPLPELEGKRYMSLNWIDANNAAQYQTGEVNVDVIDEEKETI